jgi:hypothetical protein
MSYKELFDKGPPVPHDDWKIPGSRDRNEDSNTYQTVTKSHRFELAA